MGIAILLVMVFFAGVIVGGELVARAAIRELDRAFPPAGTPRARDEGSKEGG